MQKPLEIAFLHYFAWLMIDKAKDSGQRVYKYIYKVTHLLLVMHSKV